MKREAVVIRGISFVASHGVSDEERRGTRRFEVDVEVETALRQAAETDELRDTIDYHEVARTVVETGTRRTYRLLESLAGAILGRLAERYPAAGLVVEVKKIAPPIEGTPAWTAVRLVRAPETAAGPRPRTLP